jgi:class 3 adenylate cyclase
MLHLPDTDEAIVGNMRAAQPAFYTAAGETVGSARQSKEQAMQSQIVVRDPVVRMLGLGILARRASSINIKEHGNHFSPFKLATLST